MSAFVVGNDHISYLVQAARQFSTTGWRATGYYHDGAHVEFGNWSELGAMLLQENTNSVQHRYPDSAPFDLPGAVPTPIADTYCYRTTRIEVTAAQVLKAISCYEYQSCEHPEWETSQAHSFCQWLTNAAINRIPGYEDAMWDVDESDYLAKVAAKREQIKARLAS